MLVREQTSRRRAEQLDRDIARLTRQAVTAAGRIGHRMQGAAITGFRRKTGDPLWVVRREMGRMIRILADAMFVAHYRGIAQGVRAAPIDLVLDAPMEARSVFQESLRSLQQRFSMPVTQIDSLARRYHAEAFRVVSVATASMEKKIQEAIIRTQVQGMHVRDSVKELQRAFGAAGLTPRNNFTLEAIFRTQSHLAYSAGRWHANQHPAIQEILWGYKYVTVGDDRVRAKHRILDGMKLAKNDPRWNTLYPPNGWACRCQVIEIFDKGEAQPPPPTMEINGLTVTPGADKGFRFHPGKLFGAMEAPRIA